MLPDRTQSTSGRDRPEIAMPARRHAAKGPEPMKPDAARGPICSGSWLRVAAPEAGSGRYTKGDVVVSADAVWPNAEQVRRNTAIARMTLLNREVNQDVEFVAQPPR
jgi:hypothetical protein